MARRWHSWWLAGVALASWLIATPAAAKYSFSPDVFFAEDSTALLASELGKIDVQACKAAMFFVEGAVVVGHADRTERYPPALARLRAERVARYIREHTGLRVYVDSKGAVQPVADYRNPQGRAKNRRVEVEFIFTVPDAPRPIDKPCLPQWQRHMLASTKAAPVVARAWIRDYQLAADDPLLAALRLQRWDIFAALVQDGSWALSPAQAEGVAQAAAQSGQLSYVVDWARQQRKLLTPAQWSQTLTALCNSKSMNEAQRLQAARALYQLGARSADAAPLTCAASWGDAGLVDFYLQVDGPRFVTADVVLAAGPHPAVLQQLLAAGGDIRAQDVDGATLFHTMRLNQSSDVQTLLDAGLDINARRRDGTTPLQLALEYAPLEVLETMQARGAQLIGIRAMEAAQSRPEVQMWLLDRGLGVSSEELAQLWPLWIARGAPSIPVLQSLQAHSVGVADGTAGETALARAIEAYQVELVQFLVDHGASQAAMALRGEDLPRTARERAAALQAFDVWRPCTSATPTKWCPPFHEPILNPERAQKKQAIIAILQDAATSERLER